MTHRLAWVPAAALSAVLVATGCGGDDGPAPAADAATADAFIPPPIGEFPAEFLWGAAIAPYQVEGGLHATDWYQWESGLCGNRCSGDHADDGPDFWNKYETDLANAAMMHNNAIRLGIEWGRVFPTAASWDDMTPDADALTRYHAILDFARAQGLNPMVTLHHFSTPSWLQDLEDLENKPGWEDPTIVQKFEQWAAFLATEFGDDVDWWITLNEPMVYVTAGWLGGVFPPGKSGQNETAIAVTWTLIDAHARAYDALHLHDTIDADGDGASAMVSISQHMRVYRPLDPSDPEAVRATEVIEHFEDILFVDAIVYGRRDLNLDLDTDDPGEEPDPMLAGRADYLGLNYYGLSFVVPTGAEDLYPFIGIAMQNDLDIRADFFAPITDFGWSIHPEGFREVLDRGATWGLPIVVTENGLADGDDNQRPRFLLDHLYVLGQASADMEIRGYFHWSLVDNFEWASGFCPQFGLFHFDRQSPDRTRTMGEGAEVYRTIIDANTVPVELFGVYPGYPGPGLFCPRVGL